MVMFKGFWYVYQNIEPIHRQYTLVRDCHRIWASRAVKASEARSLLEDLLRRSGLLGSQQGKTDFLSFIKNVRCCHQFSMIIIYEWYVSLCYVQNIALVGVFSTLWLCQNSCGKIHHFEWENPPAKWWAMSRWIPGDPRAASNLNHLKLNLASLVMVYKTYIVFIG